MKVLVIKGSPRVKGTTNTIVEEFIKGAKSDGHEVKVLIMVKELLNLV